MIPAASALDHDLGAGPSPQVEGRVPQGVAVGPDSQFKHLARMRAVVVLPVPRGPQKR